MAGGTKVACRGAARHEWHGTRGRPGWYHCGAPGPRGRGRPDRTTEKLSWLGRVELAVISEPSSSSNSSSFSTAHSAKFPWYVKGGQADTQGTGSLGRTPIPGARHPSIRPCAPSCTSCRWRRHSRAPVLRRDGRGEARDACCSYDNWK